ncbi:hypothetical protein PIB30_093193, partial [Stylosanthes scabra]|nr:hypothetical protein [Stylosanthes scabra]
NRKRRKKFLPVIVLLICGVWYHGATATGDSPPDIHRLFVHRASPRQPEFAESPRPLVKNPRPAEQKQAPGRLGFFDFLLQLWRRL